MLLHKLQKVHTSTPCTGRNGTQTTPKANENRQHNGTRRSKKQCNDKTKINGHEIPLVTVPKESTTISPFWNTRHQKKGDYVKNNIQRTTTNPLDLNFYHQNVKYNS